MLRRIAMIDQILFIGKIYILKNLTEHHVSCRCKIYLHLNGILNSIQLIYKRVRRNMREYIGGDALC